jgi:glycosyltransferase involved in cell wall biosynthesis
MNKRALLIAFHFPPQAASSGIQRTLSFSRHLGNHGWEPLILSANSIAYGVKNPSQLAMLPPDLVVKRAFALDAKRHLGILGRYPEILALPDRWISWWLSSVPAGLSMIRQYKPEVIWSTFPIASAPLIGLTLHRITGLPWVADFRDPMLQDDYPATKRQRKAYGWIEQQAIHRCKKAVFTTHSAMDSYKRRFPEFLHEKFAVIENGYDEEVFSAAASGTHASSPKTEAGVTLLHSGVLYADGRDPSAFFEALASLKAHGRLPAAGLRVILRATGDDPYFNALVKKYGIGDIVSIEASVPYRDALHEMLNVDGLIVFQGTPFNTQIPAKIYEYFRARKPVFGLLDAAGETARVLSAAGFQNIAAMDSTSAIIPALERFISQIQDGSAYVASEAVIAAASRANRAAELAQIFHQVTEHA